MTLPPIAEESWDAQAWFVLNEGLPFALLGYDGFLNRWAVSFNGYHGYFIIERTDAFHERNHGDDLIATIEARRRQ